MSTRPRTVAILAANTALTEILRVALETERGDRVPCFETAEALNTFLQIAPVDVIVVDADAEQLGTDEAVRSLRMPERLPNPQPGVIVLTRAEQPFHGRFYAAGADAVLRKPVVPGRLLVAIGHILGDDPVRVAQVAGVAPTRPQSSSASDAATAERPSNVIPLFGPRR